MLKPRHAHFGLVLAILPSLFGDAMAAEGLGFIFSGDRVVSARNKDEFVRLSEPLPAANLKKRFPSFTIRVTKLADCLVCATISNKSGALEIYFDEKGRIERIRSEDVNSRDIFGNAVGSSLRKAIGSNAAVCDLGAETTCRSSRMKGLNYIVLDDEKCPFPTNNQAIGSTVPTEIPSCAKIGGFSNSS